MPRISLRRLALLGVLVPLLVLFLAWQRPGGEELSYYWQLVDGHRQVMVDRRPVAELLEEGGVDAGLRERLALSQRLRDFSVAELHLPDNASYRSYTDLGRDAVLWNITAVPEFSLDPHRWCYPVVGCQSYRAYFDPQAARAQAAAMAEQGYDVRVNPVTAYSTLGRFPDPLLNTMIRREEPRLADVLFHELAHQQVYIRGDTAFNEGYATFVGHQGVRLWLEQTGQTERIRAFEARQERAARFRGLLAETRERLAFLYRSGLPEALMRIEKAVILAGLQRRFRESVAEDPEMAAWESWFDRPVNNARLAGVATYHEWVPAFAALYEQQDRDMARFHQAVARLGEKDDESRRERMRGLRERAR